MSIDDLFLKRKQFFQIIILQLTDRSDTLVSDGSVLWLLPQFILLVNIDAARTVFFPGLPALIFSLCIIENKRFACFFSRIA
jgi:hypothetical protein